MKHLLRGAEVNCVEKVTCMTERHAWFENSLKFSANMKIFWQHYLENEKSTFLACLPEHVYATILESSKTNDFFSELQKLLSPDPWNFLAMVSARLQTLERSEESKDRRLLP